MGKLKFGVSSIVLGKEQKTENLRYDSVEWGEATTIQDFFRAGGNPSSVTPTRCKFLYTFFYDPGIQKTFCEDSSCIQQKNCLFCLKTWKKKLIIS